MKNDSRSCECKLCNTPIPEKTESCMEARPNSPGGNIRNNIADDHVKLVSEDIPGNSFNEEKLAKMTLYKSKGKGKCSYVII